MTQKTATRESNKTFIEAFREADGRTIPSNKRLDEMLMVGYNFWWTRSGTVVVHANPGEELESLIRFYSLSFEVPKKYQGLKDVALVLEHPDVELVPTNPGDIYVVKGAVRHAVEEFPSAEGWYEAHEETGIPHGKMISTSSWDDRIQLPGCPNASGSGSISKRNLRLGGTATSGSAGNGYIGAVERAWYYEGDLSSAGQYDVLIACPPSARSDVLYVHE